VNEGEDDHGECGGDDHHHHNNIIIIVISAIVAASPGNKIFIDTIDNARQPIATRIIKASRGTEQRIWAVPSCFGNGIQKN
jgi:hypothetical protein